MEVETIFQAMLAFAVAIGGYFFKRIQTTLDRTNERIGSVEIELARQKQESYDVRGRLHRIEQKLDELLKMGGKT